MRKNLFKTLSVVTLVATICIAGKANCYAADNAEVAAETVESVDGANNVFTAGQNAYVDGGMYFGGYGAGYQVGMKNAQLDGDVALAGYNVDIDSCEAGDSVYLAGYNVSAKDVKANGNMFVAGFSINADKDTQAKSVIMAGSNVSFNGKAECVNLSGDNVTLGGEITGDVTINASKITIADDTVIGGTLNISSTNEPEVPSNAKIESYNFEKVEIEDEDYESAANAVSFGSKVLKSLGSGLYWSVAMIIVAMLICLLSKDSVENALDMVKSRTGIMLGTGAITIFALPFAIIIAMITVIGIPVALITATIATLLCCVSVAFAGTTLSRLVFKNMNPYLASVLGVLILEFAKKIPFVGTLIFVASALFTFGFFVQRIYLLKIKKTTVNVTEE